jgi:ectoine hydroxylase-related dioxygenase (phytanoyl-CoA dioxygenase family)
VSVLTPQLRAAWEDDGWCVIEDVVPSGLLDDAQPALSHLFPSAEEMDAGTDGERTARWRDWDAQWPEFPFRSRSLNAIVLHDEVLDLAEGLVGPDPRLYMALISAKYAGQPSGFNQLLHLDYPNQSIVVPRRDPGYKQLELFVYLTDVSEANGATRLVSRRLTDQIPVGRHTLNLTEYAHLYDEPGVAVGPAGSVVAYRPDVYHRSVDWDDPGKVRIMLHLGFKSAQAEWAGYQSWPFKGLGPEWFAFVQSATVRQLTAVGFPAPGHPYWTEETLSGVAERYPGLDLAPWRP